MAMLAILIAVGIACAPAHTAWARQDLRPAVASDPGDGVLGDPGDGEGGDQGDGDERAGIAGDPGDGSERSLVIGWLSTVVRWLHATVVAVWK